MKFALSIIIGLSIVVSFYSFQTTTNAPSLIRWGDAQPGKISKEKINNLSDSIFYLNNKNSSLSIVKVDLYFCLKGKPVYVDIDHLNSNGSLSFPIQQWLTTMKSEDKIRFVITFYDSKFRKNFSKEFYYIIE